MLYNTFFHLKLGMDESFFGNTFRRSWPAFCSIFVCCGVSSCNASRQLANQLLGYSCKSLSSGLDDTYSISTLDIAEIQLKVVMKD